MLIIKLLKKAGVKSSSMLNLDQKLKRDKKKEKIRANSFSRSTMHGEWKLLLRSESASISAMYNVGNIPITYYAWTRDWSAFHIASLKSDHTAELCCDWPQNANKTSK